MTIEVLTVQNPSSGFKNDRSPEAVAAEIQAHYEEIAARGGRVIASHVLDIQETTVRQRAAQPYRDTWGRNMQIPASSYSETAYRGNQCLFLVADFPG